MRGLEQWKEENREKSAHNKMSEKDIYSTLLTVQRC